MEIARVTLREIRLPLREPFTISSGTQSERRILLVELEDPDGAVGWGECVAMEAPIYLPETIDTAWLALRSWIVPAVSGRRLAGPEEVLPLLDRRFRGHRMAKAGVEMACWELEARRQGLSLARLLGGERREVATGISLGIQSDPGALVEKATAALAAGYRKIKMKIKPGADVAYVSEVRRRLGEEAPLAVDANSAYTLDDVAVLEALDDLDLMMIEQPLAWDDLVRHAELQRRLETPLCLDESIVSPERARDMMSLGSGRIVNLKPGRVGGFAACRAIHELCAEERVPLWCGGMLESGIGRAHNVALASLPHFTLPGDLSPSRRYWQRDIVDPEWSMSTDGAVAVPLDRPGMGVEVDVGRVEALTVRKVEL